MIDLKINVASAIKGLSALTPNMKDGIADSLAHFAAIVRNEQKRLTSVPGHGKPAPHGKPPHKQRGRLNRSLRFAPEEDGQRYVVGSAKKSHGWYAPIVNEFHPFAEPALENVRHRMPLSFRERLLKA